MKRRWLLLLEILSFAALCAFLGSRLAEDAPRPPNSIDLKVQLRGAKDKVYLRRDEQGAFHYTITRTDGQQFEQSPEEFAAHVFDDQMSRGALEVLFNTSSKGGMAWVGIGLLGQVLFTGRMIVQWIASEKSRRSVVPPAFWWMSLVGASMLLAYFLWRKDAVGVLGQGFGWFVYVRNLWMIQREKDQAPSAGEDPGPEPELELDQGR